MAGFHKNFFDDYTVENPFTDISVQETVSTTSVHIQDHRCSLNSINNLYEYSNYSKICKIGMDTAQLLKKQDELDRKEKELVKREEAIKNSSQNMRRSNWPPLPSRCCFHPCFYQDIQVDIPLEFQKIVKYLYWLWIFHATLFFVNIIGGVILHDFNIIGEGLLYLLVLTPLSYVCWFRPAYRAFCSDSSFNFMIFFLMFFFQLIVSIIHAIGVSGNGTIGIITAVIVFNTTCSIPIKIFVCLLAFSFTIIAVADLYILSCIHCIYRSTGASLAKAQQEFAKDFLQNPAQQNRVYETGTQCCSY